MHRPGIAPRARSGTQPGSGRRLALAALAGFLLFALGCQTIGEQAVCPAGKRYGLDTTNGRIVVELFPEAAPRAVGQLQALFASGFYVGRAFDYAKPHVEVRLASRVPDLPALPVEIDPVALGLDQQVIETVGEAMNRWQFELYPAYSQQQEHGDTDPRLAQWVNRWHEHYDAGFLVGTSEQEMLEAVGHRFESDLESKTPQQDAIVLGGQQPGVADASLRFLLTQMPALTGRRPVVGRVVEGLDVLGALALRPRVPPPTADKNAFMPSEPARIVAVRELACTR